MASVKGKICIVHAVYYGDVAKGLEDGARRIIKAKGAEVAEWRVPGALEIPSAIAILENEKPREFAGYVALGCVIRGETEHFNVVVRESARGLMDLGIHKLIPIGNGILAVDNLEQAKERSQGTGHKNAGEAAAKAALRLAVCAGRMEHDPYT